MLNDVLNFNIKRELAMNIIVKQSKFRIWFEPVKIEPFAKLNLFCFPFAGGGCAVFKYWQDSFCRTNIYALQLPGRERRIREKPISDISKIVDQISDALQEKKNEPFGIFGHSMGALIGFETIRLLKKKDFPAPLVFFPSAFRAPHIANPNKPIHFLPRMQFIEELKTYGATPQALIDDEETMDLLLPMIRADFSIHERYTYYQDQPLACPIMVHGGKDDCKVSSNDLKEWKLYTASSFSYTEHEGGHFFLMENRNSLLNSINIQLAKILTNIPTNI